MCKQYLETLECIRCALADISPPSPPPDVGLPSSSALSRTPRISMRSGVHHITFQARTRPPVTADTLASHNLFTRWSAPRRAVRRGRPAGLNVNDSKNESLRSGGLRSEPSRILSKPFVQDSTDCVMKQTKYLATPVPLRTSCGKYGVSGWPWMGLCRQTQPPVLEAGSQRELTAAGAEAKPWRVASTSSTCAKKLSSQLLSYLIRTHARSAFLSVS